MWLYTELSGIMQLDMCSLYKYRYWLRDRLFVQRKLTKDYFCPSGVEVKNMEIYFHRSWVRFSESITITKKQYFYTAGTIRIIMYGDAFHNAFVGRVRGAK